jgi:hypothetical protein
MTKYLLQHLRVALLLVSLSSLAEGTARRDDETATYPEPAIEAYRKLRK